MEELTAALKAAEAKAPNELELAEILARTEAAKADYDAALEELKEASVARARVYGWVRVGEETGLSPKQLHSWAKTIPGVDLSKVREEAERPRG